ncbi:MAG: DUF1127 domain-containing protein [Alphaproteobacteria bacterium]|nr:DUF1127 domain-containing protein [Alphaproteobacteria bacterium]
MTHYRLEPVRLRFYLLSDRWARAILAPFAHLLHAYRAHRTMVKLRALTDHQLQDIGLQRHEVKRTTYDRIIQMRIRTNV